MMANEIISFENVGLRYGTGDESLSDIDFQILKGQFYYITGPSGSGKTSLMKIAYLNIEPTRGHIKLFGNRIDGLDRNEKQKLRLEIGVIFQDFRLLPYMSVFDNLSLPLAIREMSSKKIKLYVDQILDWIGLREWKNVTPNKLSGGQQQLVAFARAVIFRPKLLIADEPTGNVDNNMAKRLLFLLEELNKLGSTIMLASHNQDLIKKFSHPIIHLEEGRML